MTQSPSLGQSRITGRAWISEGLGCELGILHMMEQLLQHKHSIPKHLHQLAQTTPLLGEAPGEFTGEAPGEAGGEQQDDFPGELDPFGISGPSLGGAGSSSRAL